MLILALVIPLAACAPDPAPPATTPPTPEVTATPEPVVESVVPFGGDCAAAIPATEPVVVAAGLTLTFRRFVPEAATAGGLECWWEGTLLSVFPAELVPAELAATPGPVCEDDEWHCVAAVERNGTWLQLETREGSAADGTPSWLVPLLDSVAERLTAYPSPKAAEPAPDWWETDCDTVGAVARVADRLGAEYQPGFPEDGRSNAAFVILTASGYQLFCQWYDPADLRQISIDLYPGGAAAWPAVVAEHQPSEVIALAGATDARSWSTFIGGVIATDDVNLMRIAGVDNAAVATDLLAAL